jgi:hypothetical protein
MQLLVLPGIDVYPMLPVSFMETAPANFKWLSDTERANGTDMFVRLSAYLDDIRIDTKRLRCIPYTFTTTYEEAMKCKRNKRSIDPCDYFGLPNCVEPKWMFLLRPKKGDMLRRGKVMPAFDKNGGGTEVFFANGTSDFTLVDIMPW